MDSRRPVAAFRSPALPPSFENDGYIVEKMEVYIIFHTSMKDSVAARRDTISFEKRTSISAINSLVITRN